MIPERNSFSTWLANYSTTNPSQQYYTVDPSTGLIQTQSTPKSRREIEYQRNQQHAGWGYSIPDDVRDRIKASADRFARAKILDYETVSPWEARDVARQAVLRGFSPVPRNAAPKIASKLVGRENLRRLEEKIQEYYKTKASKERFSNIMQIYRTVDEPSSPLSQLNIPPSSPPNQTMLSGYVSPLLRYA